MVHHHPLTVGSKLIVQFEKDRWEAAEVISVNYKLHQKDLSFLKNHPHLLNHLEKDEPLVGDSIPCRVRIYSNSTSIPLVGKQIT
jgi:hypothetical protein